MDLILNIILFIIDNFTSIIIIFFTVIIIYSWIDFIINKQYKYLNEYYVKYEADGINRLINKIRYMSGREFEEFCVWLFRKTGQYKKVILTPPVNDEGRDIILVDEKGNKTFVECKRWKSSSIGRRILQLFCGAMISDNIKNGIIMTTSHIHQNGLDYILKLEENTGIKINVLDLHDIEEMIRNYDMIKATQSPDM